MRPYGPKPVSLWRVINGLANAQNPAFRAQRRSWRLRYWGAVRELRRARLLVRHGPLIALSDFATKPKARLPKHLPPSVGRPTSENGGSRRMGPLAEATDTHQQVPENEIVAISQSAATGEPKSKSAPAREHLSAAARALAQMPRRPKRIWSGWINDSTRAYRNMAVVLPGNRIAFVFGVLRGRLVFTLQPGVCAGNPDEAGRSWGVVSASSVRVVRNEHAVLLGHRKRGVCERSSELKIATARANGRQPPRAGRRPRGRPRTVVRVTPMNMPTTAYPA